MKLQTIYWNQEHYYSVCKCDRTPDLVLCVVAGGILMYHVVIELNSEEVSTIRPQPSRAE